MTQTLTKEDFITIRLSKGKFRFLLSTIKAFSDNLYSWGFDKFFEKRMLEDLKTMKAIIEEGV